MLAFPDVVHLSRTNSPACVVAAFPARLSRRARFTVAFSAICNSPFEEASRKLDAISTRVAAIISTSCRLESIAS